MFRSYCGNPLEELYPHPYRAKCSWDGYRLLTPGHSRISLEPAVDSLELSYFFIWLHWGLVAAHVVSLIVACGI